MYALPNKTQHKLIAKVRGGISQLDNFTASSSASTSSVTNSSSLSTSFGNNTKLSAPLLTGASPFSAVPSLRESPFNKHVDGAGFEAELSKLPQPIFHSIQNGGNKKLSSHSKAQKQYITPEHNEMIKYVQQSWKGVERDYKKSVNNYINKLDINSPSDSPSHLKKVTKKNATGSSPLLLSGSYHHHTSSASTSGGSNRQDTFRPFDLEAFWGNRILKRLTEEL